MRAWRLSTQIFIGLVVLLGLVLILILASYRVALQERREAEIENATAIGQVLSSAVDAFVRDLENTTLAMVAALSAQPESLSQQRNEAYVGTVLAAHPHLRALFVTDTAGRVIVAQNAADVGTDLSARPYVKALQAGAKAVWSDMLRGIQSGTVTVAFGRIIPSPTGAPKGYLIAAFFPERVFELLPVRLAADARVTLLDRRGQLLFTDLKGSVPPGVTDFSAAPDVRRALGGEMVVLDRRQGRRSGEERFGVIVPIPRTGWAVSYTRPGAAIQAVLQAQFFSQGAQLAVVLVVLGALAAVFIIRLTRPLSVLAASAAGVARGERPDIAPSTGPLLEVRQLAEGMAAMSRAVAEREDTLRRERGRLAFLGEASVLLGASLDPATILRQLARLTVPRVADWTSVYTIEVDGTAQRLEIAHADPIVEDRVRGLTSRYPPDMRGPQAEDLRAGRTLLIANLTEETIAALTPHEEMRALVRELAVRSLIAVPLIARGQVVAMMV
ncbi:MAG: cache domain-containing protein, partial [Candidatus Rokuibacteriota bacterium]